MADVTREQVLDRLRTVEDPELHKDLVTLNMIKDVQIDGSTVEVHVELTTPACPLKEKIGGDVHEPTPSPEAPTKSSPSAQCHPFIASNLPSF